MVKITKNRESRAAGVTTAATVALSIGLALCIVGAFMFVQTNKRKQAKLNAARTSAQSIINQVAENGLASYLGSERTWRYYIVNDGAERNGFELVTTQAEQRQDGRTFIKGAVLRYIPTDDGKPLLRRVRFEISDDLSSYIHSESIKQLGDSGNADELVYGWENQMLIGPRVNGRSVSARGQALQPLPQNAVPAELLDFFTSLATQDTQADPALFTICIIVRSNVSSELVPIQCLIKPDADVPQNIIDDYPDGHAATNTIELLGQTQHLYYDSQNNLLWQSDAADSQEVITRVEFTELQRHFPMINDLLQTQLGLRLKTAQPGTIQK